MEELKQYYRSGISPAKPKLTLEENCIKIIKNCIDDKEYIANLVWYKDDISVENFVLWLETNNFEEIEIIGKYEVAFSVPKEWKI